MAQTYVTGNVITGKERVAGLYVSADREEVYKEVQITITRQPPLEGYVAIRT